MTLQTLTAFVKKRRPLLSFLLQAVIIAFLVWFLAQNTDAIGALRNVSLAHLLGIALLDVLGFLINSAVNYSMIRRFDQRVTFADSVMLQYVNNLLNKILPTIGGGAAFRAYYLKKKYQFPYTYFASTIAGLYVISFFTTALIGLLCSALIYTRYGAFNLLIVLAFLGILFVTLMVMLFSPRIPQSERRYLRLLGRVVEGWNVLKKDPRLVALYTLLTVLLLCVSTLQTALSYLALGAPVDPVAMLFLSTLSIILAFLNFTPDGIGVKEGVYVLSKNLARLDPGVLILGSLLLRGVSIVTTFTIGGLSYWFLTREMRRLDRQPAP